MPIPTLDFETYSAAGFVWNPPSERKPLGHWSALPGARVKGLAAVGGAAYSEHSSTEVLTCSYDLCDGAGVQRWKPGDAPPVALWRHVAAGRPLESHNAMFECNIWTNVCVPKYGWPELPPRVQRCSMATAHVDQYPGGLDALGDVLRLDARKDKEGKALIKRFCIPRDPTKADPRTRIMPADDPAGFERLCEYCDQDVRTEMAAADAMPPMTDAELGFWLIDQEVNSRGLAIDRDGVRDCIAILGQVLERYGDECRALTSYNPTQVAKLKEWITDRGVPIPDMRADTIKAYLTPGFLEKYAIEDEEEGEADPDFEAYLRERKTTQGDNRPPLPPHLDDVRKVLEYRALTGSASVKKVHAIHARCSRDNRLRNLIVHHGARTGRPTGEGPQPLNLPKAGPKLVECTCGRPHRAERTTCPWCGAICPPPPRRGAWKPEYVDHVLEIISTHSLDMVEAFFGDAMLCISGCVRGLFVAGAGCELIASDYSAIEAVVAAMLAGEQWRIDAFQRNDPIYLVGASKITGTSLDDYLAYHAAHGEHHPDRQRIGKVSELACGFGGWIGSYKAFGSTEPDDVIKAQILAWRAASPAIVEMWGGQWRGRPWDRDRRPELYGLEGMAVAAIQSPGVRYEYRGIGFEVIGTPASTEKRWDALLEDWYDVPVGRSTQRLMLTLPSGRQLTYHEPMLTPGAGYGGDELAISYATQNSNPKYGALGWVRMNTYGGRLFENVVQAVAHDIQRHGIILLRLHGYPLVLGVYDEDVVEVPAGYGSVEEVERLMGTMPAWAAGWPIRASGGWRGRRYRKG